MAQQSFPFEDIDVTETQFSQWASNFQDYGVKGVPGDTQLKVTGDDSGLQVRVATGQAFIRGHYFINTTQATVSIATAGALTRIDAIVLELDVVSNQVILKAVQGTAVASDPVAPVLTQTETGIYQMLLAYVTIPNDAVSIVFGDVTDRRSFMGNRLGVWTDETRPTDPVAQQTIGYNVDRNGHELWSGSEWQLFGNWSWSTASRPLTPNEGFLGYNTTLGYHEYWDGSAWVKQVVVPEPLSPFLLMGA